MKIFVILPGSSGTLIEVVANYAALPIVSTVAGQFYWCSNSQGTSWLPGSLGGTYYPAGMYYSNGTTWEYIKTPYQATQIEVDAGINNDKFVTPLTFTNSAQLANKVSYAIESTGNTISFAVPEIYNRTSPITGNILENLTGAALGVVQKIYHNHSVAPTFPAGWVKLGTGNYTTSSLNIIYAEFCGGSIVEYWIVKGS